MILDNLDKTSHTFAFYILIVLFLCSCSPLVQDAHAQDSSPARNALAGNLDVVYTPQRPNTADWDQGVVYTAAHPVVALTPYFASSSPYFVAATRLEKGMCPEALNALAHARKECGDPCEARNALDLLHADILLCTSDNEDAFALLEQLYKRGYPGMDDRVRASYERAALRLQRPVPWKNISKEELVSSPSLRPPSAKRASVYARKGDNTQAIQEYTRFLDTNPSKHVARKSLLALARAYEAENDPIRASQSAYRAWRRDLSRAQKAEDFLLRLAEEHSDLPELTRLSIADVLDRLEILARSSKSVRKASSKKKSKRRRAKRSKKRRKKTAKRARKRSARRSKQAKGSARTSLSTYLKYVQTKVLTKPADRKAVASWVKGHQLEARRDREEALTLFEEAAKLTTIPALRARAHTGRALALRRLSRDAQAIDLYVDVANTQPQDQHLAPEALYQAARLNTYKHNHIQAKTLLLRLLAEYPNTNHRDEAFWMLGWSSWMTQDTARARDVFEHIATHYPDTHDLSGLPARSRALYWQARAHARLGERERALRLFREVFRSWPLTYYAALSSHQLRALGEPVPVATNELEKVQSLVEPKAMKNLQSGFTELDPRVAKSVELMRLGQTKEAEKILRGQISTHRAPALSVELHALKKEDLSERFWMASRYGTFDRPPHSGNARLWGLAYPAPTPYQEIAKEVGKEFSMDPMLPFAIMRHESGFKVSSESVVGAVGLMQIMPKSAQAAHKIVLGEKGPSRKKLSSPKTNIRTGMMLLYMMNNYFRGNLPLAIGAYNAGSGVAERWFDQYQGMDTDLVVELMTYPRTAAYVKKVISSYYAYRVLYGDGTAPPIPLQLPKSTGDWTEPTPQGPMSAR